jgi:GT2 family glycosyltransferase
MSTPDTVIDGFLTSPARTVSREKDGLQTFSRIRTDGRAFAQGGRGLRVQGVTYGPFAPDALGDPFPSPPCVQRDFTLMRAAGVNAIRVYHAPPAWFLEAAEEQGISLLVDIAWPKDMCFLESETYQRQAREAVRNAVQRGSGSAGIFAYSIGNEIAPDIVRWQGAKRVEKFLAELYDVSKQHDSEALATYANFPSTEYLDLSFLDFATFNVYLHDPEVFRRYLVRLMNRIGDRPLLLGELGMDTLRHEEGEQAAFLNSHLATAARLGVAGAFVFSWTDDWHTHGFQIEDWAFGITDRDRTPKSGYYAVGDVFHKTPAQLLEETVKVSVVVCSYNGGGTLDQCLRSLLALDYPDYEIILVDDGSTDDTPAIAARFPEVQTIRQPNCGLSVARNVGLQAATGEIVAYTDSDCFADPNWLTHLVDQFQRTGAAGVGGPNLTPDDGWLAACIAASPGQPTHVLASDQLAEHIPGCNMAFKKSALEALKGFNPVYRKAGDDVDICWRLQQAGMWVSFAPGAFVWHHRRQTVKAYFKQQMGYGEAEAILSYDHPERFNMRGESKWEGNMYGGSLPGLRFGQPIIYAGVFGAGLFQTLYQPATSYWPLLPNTLEWWTIMGLSLLVGLSYHHLFVLTAAMLTASLSVSLLRAAQAAVPRKYNGPKTRLLIALMCLTQPLVRSWRRYRWRIFPPHLPRPDSGMMTRRCSKARILRSSNTIFYDTHWRERDRIALLDGLFHALEMPIWGVQTDTGWSGWDFTVRCHPWTKVEITTAREAGGLFRILYRLRLSEFSQATLILGAVGLLLAFTIHVWLPAIGGLLLLLGGSLVWWQGTYLAGCVQEAVENSAAALGLSPFTPEEAPRRKRDRRTGDDRGI